jgi:hypothetical protein
LEKAGEIFRNYKEISSILLISDGIFNQGLDPLNSLSNINVPVYTVGIGDSSSYPDLSIERIRNNSTIYAEKESDIEVVVLSNDPSVNSTEIQIYDNNDLFFTKKFEISESGINRIIVPYLTAKEGKHQIRVVVNPLPGEKNSKNNSKSVLINVLASKKSIAVISGIPGRDLSAVVKSIKSNKDFSLYQITELGNGKFYNDERDTEKIRNADAVFLIGFPSQNSNDAFAAEIFNIISSEKKNIFMAPGFDFDYVFVNKLSSGFPISFSAIQSRLLESQVKAQSSFTGLLGSNTEMLSEWSDLPPVTLPENGLTIDGQHDILLTDNLERPVMFSGSYSGKKIIFLNCINFWRWKLMSPFDENPVFDNMIFNSIKWLSLSTNDFFTVGVSKENFILGEEIYFKANLYSSTFEPLSNENISLEVYNKSYNEKYTFSPQGSGIYDLNIKVPKPGIYNYIAEVSDSSSNISPVKGTLNIDQLELEFADQTMKKNLLTAISENSGGKYYDINNTVNLLSELKSNYENKIYNEKIDKELRLSNFELILFLLVLFFSIEWITRKFMQMI